MTEQSPRPLRGYALSISQAVGVTDPETLATVEDCMRHTIFHSTLDWQSREEFDKGAREALAVVQALGLTPQAMQRGAALPATLEAPEYTVERYVAQGLTDADRAAWAEVARNTEAQYTAEKAAKEAHGVAGSPKVDAFANSAARQIGDAFGRLCLEAFTAEQMAEIRERNAAEPEGGSACHTHDFLDANEIMARAFEECGFPTCVEFDSESPDHEAACVLWNAAWGYAFGAYLTAPSPAIARRIADVVAGRFG